MRKSNPVAAVADKTLPTAGRQDRAPVQLVCMALILSVIVLGCRIVSIW
jgi:hypothetical protein